jgi:hypothetical protein
MILRLRIQRSASPAAARAAIGHVVAPPAAFKNVRRAIIWTQPHRVI